MPAGASRTSLSTPSGVTRHRAGLPRRSRGSALTEYRLLFWPANWAISTTAGTSICRVGARSGPRECGDPVEPGQLLRVGDDVDAGDPTVLDGDAHRRVERGSGVDA